LNPPRNFLRNRMTRLMVLLAVLAMILAGNQPEALAVCPDAAFVAFYSDATRTTQVGLCYHGCCELWNCSGDTSTYHTTVYYYACD
jgi:hypothetical protein